VATGLIDEPVETHVINVTFEVIEGFNAFWSTHPVPNAKVIVYVAFPVEQVLMIVIAE